MNKVTIKCGDEKIHKQANELVWIDIRYLVMVCWDMGNFFWKYIDGKKDSKLGAPRRELYQQCCDLGEVDFL
jgi:hypothetical protein